jgi:hypothetical protein
MLILPLVPLAMALTFIAGMGGLFLPSGTPVGLPADFVLSYMTDTAMTAGNVSWASMDVAILPFAAACMYLFIGAACLYMWRVTRLHLEETSLVE